MKKIFLVSILFIFILSISFSENSVIEKVGMGEIDWTKGVIKMKGQGAPPKKSDNIAQARLMAIKAAKADAMRNFLEVVNGVRVTSETLVKNMVVVSDEIKTKVEGVVNGFFESKVGYLSDGSVYVEIVFPLYGKDGLSPIVLPQVVEKKVEVPVEKIKEVKIKDEECERMLEQLKNKIVELENLIQELKRENAKLEREKKEVVTSQEKFESKEQQKPLEIPLAATRAYTGIIIDATGLGAKPCMSPKIFSESGEEVYGTLNISPDVAIEEGIVSYAKTVTAAKNLPRAGENPYIVRANRVEGSFKANLIISREDAEILKEMKDVLKKCRVVIVL